MATPTGGTSATNPFEVVTPQATPTNKRPRPEELLNDKSKKMAHEEDLKDIFTKLGPTLEVLEQEIRSLLHAEKLKQISEDELTSNLRRMLVHTESATRKGTRLEEAITSCAYLNEENEELRHILRVKEEEIKELKRRIDNSELPCRDLLRVLEEGVADEMWGKLVRQPWPGEGFKATKVITREDYEGTGIMVIVISDDDTDGTDQVKALNIPKGAKSAIENDELTSDSYAKIISTEMTHVNGKAKRLDTTT
ncbi:unnamed protein product [Bemisia tabaci]|uniref:Uncharacterized protein n=1 Tax=Bemisia tabaci TaxID=7038 RepID=A0A9N9ZZQ6_BEMTA|nr:unnamed protein product [Bemisia tabaci]